MVDEQGYVHIVGRDKDLVISGGYNVYPKEVEQVIDELQYSPNPQSSAYRILTLAKALPQWSFASKVLILEKTSLKRSKSSPI